MEYKGKTYLFLGNSFAERFHEQLDTASYTSAVWYRDGKIQEQYYPKYQREFERRERYQYNESGKIEKMVAEMKNRYSKVISSDSTVYQYKKKAEDYDLVVKKFSRDTLEQRYTIREDTSLIEEFINSGLPHVIKEYKKGERIKVQQIIKPKMSGVIITTFYDEFGNELKLEKTENGETWEIMRYEYTYDQFDRITEKRTYSEPGHVIMSLEITTYE